ncbi:MAG: transcriptional repressor [Candidatus Symbiothrix sp.]|jgi:Fur family ferric uptake transcriptional regulator|nr:transcriptional repressor [Candidatus Symbiothrix sp.]
MDKDRDIKQAAKQKFTDYLTANKCRKTPERFAILELIYSDMRHFDIDTLSVALQKSGLPVSRATLYNTMRLLVDCKLIVKHRLDKNRAFYERASTNDFHLHLVCTNCLSITDYKDTELQRAILNKKIKKFKPVHYALNVSGLCSECARQLKKNKKK